MKWIDWNLFNPLKGSPFISNWVNDRMHKGFFFLIKISINNKITYFVRFFRKSPLTLAVSIVGIYGWKLRGKGESARRWGILMKINSIWFCLWKHLFYFKQIIYFYINHQMDVFHVIQIYVYIKYSFFFIIFCLFI